MRSFLHRENYTDHHIDFTKQYNRLRQHVAVRTGNAHGITSSINHSNAVANLPAVNHPRSATALASQPKDKTADQLAALAKYSSRIAKIDLPYRMGVGVNRKGPSSYANTKDKSDRATNEQVLDPRTRIILFKMIGRGLLHEVNGCVSTGKEVCQGAGWHIKLICRRLFRQMYIMPLRQNRLTLPSKSTKLRFSFSKTVIDM